MADAILHQANNEMHFYTWVTIVVALPKARRAPR